MIGKANEEAASTAFGGDLFVLLAMRSRAILAFGFTVTLLFGIGILKVVKDPSVDAFVPDNHPAAVARAEARAVFGLEDPLVLAVLAPDGQSAFTPNGLTLLRDLDEAVRALDGVTRLDVVSLASENAISGDRDALYVDPILPDGIIEETVAAQARDRAFSMPMLNRLLYAPDGSALMMLIPVQDPNDAEDVYTAVVRTAADLAQGYDLDVEVAGVAAMNARLSAMVNQDTRIFVPVTVVIVLLIVAVAVRHWAAVLAALVIIAGSCAVSIGLLGWLDARYYLISTALPVVIMAIAVADGLHISLVYFKALEDHPKISSFTAMRYALGHTFLPITFTSITTIAGFLGLSMGVAMQPIREFGLFAAVGVASAWSFSLTALPAIYLLTSPRHTASGSKIGPVSVLIDRATRALTHLSRHHPRPSILILGVALIGLVIAANHARFDYERRDYFQPGEPVCTADMQINDRFGGINFLDIMIEAEEPEALMTPAALSAIADLRTQLEALPLVTNVTAIDDYIAHMHLVLTDAALGALPERQNAPSQYMFLYEASSSPEDFKQEIDYDWRRALIRAQLSTDSFRLTKPVVERSRDIARIWSDTHGMRAEVSGRVGVNEGWMSALASSHVFGLGLAVAMVFAAVWIQFRSLFFALCAMIPVLTGTLCVYAVMGLFAINIAPATSMTAAIATGLGVDFGVHLITVVRRRLHGGDLDFFAQDYTVTARACMFSALSLCIALSALLLSAAPPLQWFGILVSAGAAGSLFGAVVLIPAIFSLLATFKQKELSHA